MSDTSDRVEPTRLLLSKLAAAEDRRLTAARLGPKKVPGPYRDAGLPDQAAITAAVADLAARGWVTQVKQGRSVWVELTDAGAAHLDALPPRPEPPAKSRRRTPPPPPDEPENPNLVGFQRAFLLTQLLSAPDRTLTEGQANKLPKVAQEDLELSPGMARQLRRKLADAGHLRAEKDGRSLRLTLTAEGLGHLASLAHHPAGAFTVTGAALNDLLDAARRGAPSQDELRAANSAAEPAGATGDDRPAARDGGPAAAAAPPADLAAAAYAAFRELARERYSRNGLVPVFAVRQEVARRHGPAAARHDALDVPILQLRRAGKVRLISISDTRAAAADELEDSITNAYETLFYMEDADGQPGTR